MGTPIKSALLGAAVACALGVVPAATQAANSDYDNLNGVTLGDTPYTSVMPFVAPVQSFDNSTFTADQEYSNMGAPTYGACQAWGWRSAWVRFATAVKGRVFVTVDSSAPPGYDVFYAVFTAPTSIPPGSASMSQLSQVECQNANSGMPNEDYTFGHQIEANRTIYVQVMSVCANRTDFPVCSDAEKAGAPGGPTTLSVRFTPYNGDNDGVADTLDECPGTPGAVRGCPDGDDDGVPDPSDACPGTKGSRADGCRVPDEDGDHYNAGDPDPRLRDCNDDNPDVHPGVPEVRGNGVDENCDGLAAFDKDGDDWDDKPGPDCNPDKKAVHPHARDKPGNGVDENCDGHDARFPRVTSEVAPLYLAVNGRTVGFARFKVLPVRRGDRVRIECVGGGCPFSAKTYGVSRSRPEMVVGKQFVSHQLARGARVTVKIMRAGYVGRAVRYTLHGGPGKPRVQKRCMPPGRPRPVERC